MAGFKGSRVVINALGVCKMAACFKFGVTLKAFRGVVLVVLARRRGVITLSLFSKL